MASGDEQQAWIEEEAKPNPPYLQKFKLYETRSVYHYGNFSLSSFISNAKN